MKNSGLSKFSKMNREELLHFCRELYKQIGIQALSYPELKKLDGLYYNLYSKGISHKILLKELGLQDEFKEKKGDFFVKNYNGQKKAGWTWRRIIDEAKAIQKMEGFLPPAGWFQKNGHASLVAAVYTHGHNWEELRHELGDFKSSLFVQSRNGLRWRSHPEASLSNFLYARGVEHKRGERYSEAYETFANAKGYFDLHFLDNKNRWIDVEIWGDNPGGHGEKKYGDRRRKKELFHQGKETFLGIHYNDCFNENKISEIINPYIGKIDAFNFDKPTDKIIPTTHWSNTDELLEYCKFFTLSMPDGKFPTEEWLRKRGKHSGREGETYNTLAVYIKLWFGGVRNLRNLLGQGYVSTQKWDKELAIKAYQDFYNEHGLTPSQMRQERNKKNSEFSKETINQAACISAAIIKYANGTNAVDKFLNIKIDLTRKWTEEKIIEKYKEVIERFGVSPSQLIYDYHKNKKIMPEDDYIEMMQAVDAASRKFGGSKKIYQILKFKPPLRKRAKRGSLKK